MNHLYFRFLLNTHCGISLFPTNAHRNKRNIGDDFVVADGQTEDIAVDHDERTGTRVLLILWPCVADIVVVSVYVVSKE